MKEKQNAFTKVSSYKIKQRGGRGNPYKILKLIFRVCIKKKVLPEN